MSVQGQVNPMAMSLADAARVLGAVGGQQVTVEMIQAHLNAGFPPNEDGTINVILYAAWLNGRLRERDGD